MPQATLRIRSNDPQSPADLPLKSLIGNQAQTAECDPGYAGDDVVVAEGVHTAHTLAQANAAALAVAEGGLECIPLVLPDLSLHLLLGVNTSFGYALAALGSGGALFGGAFTHVGATAQAYLARCTNAGVLDVAFAPVLNAVVNAVLVVGTDYYFFGNFTSVNATTRNRGAVLSSAGVLGAFNPNIAGGAVNCVARQTDGKLIIGGAFTTVGGDAQPYLARLNADGTRDTSFNPTIATIVTIKCIVIQPDGKILVGGSSFALVNGDARVGCFRLNADGTTDPTFVANTLVFSGTSIIEKMAVDSSGRVILVGVFDRINGTNKHNVARVSSTGVLETATFDPAPTGYGAAAGMRSVKILASGKICVGGEFSAIGGGAQDMLAILNTDGTRDTSFSPTPSTFGSVYEIVQEVGNQITCVGFFATINGASHRSIVRLDLDGTLP